MAAGATNQQLASMKRNLADAELNLRRKLYAIKCLVPTLGHVQITPNESINTSFDVPPSPVDQALGTERRDERGSGQPYFLHNVMTECK